MPPGRDGRLQGLGLTAHPPAVYMTIVMTKVTSAENRTIPREMLRERIYDAALALFRSKGFEATTVDQIARKAQVAKGTVFNFFPTKGAILLHYYEELDAEFGAAMTAMSTQNPKAALTEFYGKAEALLRKEGPLAHAIFRQIALDPDIQNADLDSGEKDRGQMIRFFRDCQAKDTLSADVEPAVAAHIVTDLWGSTVADWLRTGQRYSLKLRLATKLDAIFRGFAPAARAAISAFAMLLALLIAAPPSHAATTDPTPMQGLYQDAKGAVAIVPFAEFGDGLFYVDYASGRTGPLVAMPNGMAVGVGMKSPKTYAGTVAAVAKRLSIDIDGVHRMLDAIPVERRPFVVTNGDVKLAGEFVHRTDSTPIGGIVIVHGSNDEPRTVFGPWVDYLAWRGWTVAVFDKRGSGQSTGDWKKGGFEELASDVRAVARFTHAQAPLKGKPVGLLGISQAGWVMPLAAQDGGIDFIVSLMGAGVTPAEQTLEFTQAQLEAYEIPKAEIAEAMAYYRLDLDVSTGKKPWADIDAAYKKAMAEKAEWLLAPPEPANSGSRAFLGRIADFDPAPYWAKLRIPVLAMFGGVDLVVPSDPNRALIEKQLSTNGNPATKIVMIDNVNHVGMIAKTGTIAEYPTLDHFDPGYFKTFGDWLDGIAKH